MTSIDKSQLLQTIDNETIAIQHGVSAVDNKLSQASLNLASVTNWLGKIESKTENYTDTFNSFKKRAGELSQKLNRLKKGIHSAE